MDFLDHFLVDFLKNIPDTDIIQLFELTKTVNVKKNEIFIEQGVYHYKAFYVKKGLIRGYHTNPEGEEKTIFFSWENEFGADPDCFLNKRPARLSWCAIEDSEILEINFEKYEELSKKNSDLLNLRVITIQKLLNRMYERIENFILHTPEERYQSLLISHPDLCDRIPYKFIASFLGITPVSLSRIRKRLKN